MEILGIPIKDVATIALSFAALITSVSVAFYNRRIQTAKSIEDARKVFDEAIEGLQTARWDREALRVELGESYGSAMARPRRVMITDRRNFYLAKALTALQTGGFKSTSVDNLLIAASLMDSGRPAAATRYYDASVQFAEDAFDRATARRVFGRAQLISGDFVQGREEMLKAVGEFLMLAEDHGYDRARMRNEASDAARRLVDASDIVGFYDCMDEDLKLLDQLSSRAGNVAKEEAAPVIERLRNKLSPESSKRTTELPKPIPRQPAKRQRTRKPRS